MRLRESNGDSWDYWRIMRPMGTHENQRPMENHENQRNKWRPMGTHETQRDHWGLRRETTGEKWRPHGDSWDSERPMGTGRLLVLRPREIRETTGDTNMEILIRLRETNGDQWVLMRLRETNGDSWDSERLMENNGDSWDSERPLETHETQRN